jgi:hypothetical protein
VLFFFDREKSEKYLERTDLVEPLDDLRRPDSERGTWAAPKIKKREQAILSSSLAPSSGGIALEKKEGPEEEPCVKRRAPNGST